MGFVMSGMGMGMHLGQKMSQVQILAPRMIQSMEILQLPIMALEERIQQELQENPVLELRENEPGAEDEEPGPAVAVEDDRDPGDRELVIDGQQRRRLRPPRFAQPRLGGQLQRGAPPLAQRP